MWEPRSLELCARWWLCELRHTLLGVMARMPKTFMKTSASFERDRIA